MTHYNIEPPTSPSPGAGQAQQCTLGGIDSNWWTVGRKLWQKIASEMSEEEDDRMKEVLNDQQELGNAMKDKLGHVVVSEANDHGEGRHQAWEMETRKQRKEEASY